MHTCLVYYKITINTELQQLSNLSIVRWSREWVLH